MSDQLDRPALRVSGRRARRPMSGRRSRRTSRHCVGLRCGAGRPQADRRPGAGARGSSAGAGPLARHRGRIGASPATADRADARHRGRAGGAGPSRCRSSRPPASRSWRCRAGRRGCSIPVASTAVVASGPAAEPIVTPGLTPALAPSGSFRIGLSPSRRAAGLSYDAAVADLERRAGRRPRAGSTRPRCG